MTAEGPLDALVFRGTADLAGTRLKGFDLAGKMGALANLAGIGSSSGTEIETFSSAFEMSPKGVRVERLLLVVPTLGTLSGAGRISPEQALDFALRAALEPPGALGAGLGRLLKRQKLDIPFFVRGNMSDPAFVPDPRTTRTVLDSVLPGGAEEKSVGERLRDLLK